MSKKKGIIGMLFAAGLLLLGLSPGSTTVGIGWGLIIASATITLIEYMKFLIVIRRRSRR